MYFVIKLLRNALCLIYGVVCSANVLVVNYLLPLGSTEVCLRVKHWSSLTKFIKSQAGFYWKTEIQQIMRKYRAAAIKNVIYLSKTLQFCRAERFWWRSFWPQLNRDVFISILLKTWLGQIFSRLNCRSSVKINHQHNDKTNSSKISPNAFFVLVLNWKLVFITFSSFML